MSWLLLGTDSFIACVAVGALVSKRSWVPLALVFGLADGLGTVAGNLFHWNVPGGVATYVELGFMVGLGVYWIGVSLISGRMKGTGWVWALPWILTIDNITFGLIDHAWSHSVAVQGLEAALSSAIQAGLGIAVSVIIVRGIPRVINTARERRARGGVAIATSGGGTHVAPIQAAIPPAVIPALAGVAMIAAGLANYLWG